MKQITTTQKITGLMLIVLLLVAVAYYFAYQHIAVLEGGLAVLREEQHVADMEEQNKDAVLALLNNTQKERDELESYLLNTEDPTDFFTLVEDLSSHLGVSFEFELSLTDNQNNKEDTEQYVNLVGKIEGEWENIYKLTTLFETMPYAVTITRLAVEQQKDEAEHEWGGQIHMQVSAKTQ